MVFNGSHNYPTAMYASQGGDKTPATYVAEETAGMRVAMVRCDPSVTPASGVASLAVEEAPLHLRLLPRWIVEKANVNTH